MRPDKWGPHAWILLHAITLDYPENPDYETKRTMRNFFNSLGGVLPCSKCKMHFKQNLEKYPLTDYVLSSRTTLVKWLIDVHNSVNQMTGKPVLSYEQSLREIMGMYNDTSDVSMYLFIVVFIILILLFVYLSIKK